MTEHEHYAALFSREIIEAARGRIDDLDKIVRLFEGK